MCGFNLYTKTAALGACECGRRKGSYLPTVPELTHMPLCWWFSRSLKPDKETEEVDAFAPLVVPDSHKANAGVAQQDRVALSHPPRS